jgi:hypothetical protein
MEIKTLKFLILPRCHLTYTGKVYQNSCYLHKEQGTQKYEFYIWSDAEILRILRIYEDNMKYEADKTTPGATTPIITTTTKFSNEANIGLKTAYDTMLTNRRWASQSLSSLFIHFIHRRL